MAFNSLENPDYSSYPERRRAGSRLQSWLDTPSHPCPIPKSKLTLTDLINSSDWKTDQFEGPHGLPHTYAKYVTKFRLDISLDCVYTTRFMSRYEKEGEDIDIGYQNWGGITGPGVIILQNIFRTNSEFLPTILPSGELSKDVFPFMSQVTQAIYEAGSESSTGRSDGGSGIDDLRYVFVSDIVNVDTKSFVRYLHGIYCPCMSQTRTKTKTKKETKAPVSLSLSSDSDDSNELSHCQSLDPHLDQVLEWEYGTPDYKALLATRIGKIVVYLLLGGSERGTRRIARIVTWFDINEMNGSRNLQMRFDIERV